MMLHIASVVLAAAFQVRATAPRDIELSLSVSDASVALWDAIAVDVKVRNLGHGPIPFGDALLSGHYGGALLRLVVEDGTTRVVRELTLDPKLTTDCDETRTEELLPDEGKSLASLVGGTVDVVVNAEKTGTDRVLLPLFPHVGNYVVRAEYVYGGQVVASTPVNVFAHVPAEAHRGVLDNVKRLGVNAYWLYEPTAMPSGLSEVELAPLAAIAEGPSCRYADYAALALADYYVHSAQPFVTGRAKIAPAEECIKKASHYLGLIRSSSIAESQPSKNTAAKLASLRPK